MNLQMGKAGGEKWKSMSEAVRYKRFLFLFVRHIHYSNLTNNTVHAFFLLRIHGQIVMRFRNFYIRRKLRMFRRP